MQLPIRWTSTFAFQAALGAALCAGPLAATAPALPGLPSIEVLQFAVEVKAALLDLKSSLKTLDVEFVQDINALKQAVKDGSKSPAQAHEELFDRLDTLFAAQAVLLNGLTDTIELDASQHLGQLNKLPNAMTVGDGGLIDEALHGANDFVHQSTVKAFVKVRSLAKKLEKANDYDLVGDRRPRLAQPMTPTEDLAHPAEAPKTLLWIDLLLAGSDRSLDNDGRIFVAGTADPGNGTDITVTLTRPGDLPIVVATTVDGSSHRWQISEPASLPGSLPEGNYSVDVTQGDVTISDSIGMQ